MSDPDKLAADVRATQDSLRTDVDRLTGRVSPDRIVGTRRDKIKGSFGTVREHLMGSSDSAGGAAADKAGSAVKSVHDATNSAAGSLGDAAGSAPDAVRGRTKGNPIATGLIAFGTGWLLSSLVPASDAERKAAQHVEDNAGDIVEPLKQSAQEMAGNLQEPVQQAAQAVQSTTSDAVSRTTEHAKSATADVKDQAARAGSDVADEAAGPQDGPREPGHHAS